MNWMKDLNANIQNFRSDDYAHKVEISKKNDIKSFLILKSYFRNIHILNFTTQKIKLKFI